MITNHSRQRLLVFIVVLLACVDAVVCYHVVQRSSLLSHIHRGQQRQTSGGSGLGGTISLIDGSNNNFLLSSTRTRTTTTTVLYAAQQQEGTKRKKKKRRRKQPPPPPTTTTTTSSPAGDTSTSSTSSTATSTTPETTSTTVQQQQKDESITSTTVELKTATTETATAARKNIPAESAAPEVVPVKKEEEPVDPLTRELLDVANFEFKPGAVDSTNLPPIVMDDLVVAKTTGVDDVLTAENDDTAENLVPLPDIKGSKRRMEIEREMARIEREKEASRPKIKRSDTEAMRKLIERRPFADADPSYFEEEKYDAVSAILGERATKFLGSIPTGPIQVAHLIGALVIVLMAFIDYPGFPLTNLPSPIRVSLQGGLAAVYSINFILAISSIFTSMERGQPLVLWITKTFAVGGLAYDQLKQLPTLKEIEKANAVKGKRAAKK